VTKKLAVDSNNDLYIDGTGSIAFVEGLDCVLQNCEHAMKTMLGECVLDIERGIPNFETIWLGSPNVPQYVLAARVALEAVADVDEVTAFDTAQVGDVLTYSATIVTVYGTGIIA